MLHDRAKLPFGLKLTICVLTTACVVPKDVHVHVCTSMCMYVRPCTCMYVHVLPAGSKTSRLLRSFRTLRRELDELIRSHHRVKAQLCYSKSSLNSQTNDSPLRKRPSAINFELLLWQRCAVNLGFGSRT